ncbi:hypothetical protein NL108_008710 [Boleophthalmus pectinirostris]|uniref:aurora kinase A and ninein-interacting protein n=1 Tax=Boleophthalmus pectinirostris TaxID=150288 RepID=UPI00242F4B95|nr:aurora kinase A and ninein-interacting protein [Boleophthalmus pectinirostris]XP_055013617.1 aurora kinase A and ninein-interacting protein [Boleophthalmus pectinirostris]KAJ0054989.1 hypothetical protein NL108_008710 [Boleophthalmus pectinirostris]
MKTSRAAAQNSVKNKEDCGVWLDTLQLKRKVQKKRSARPISKLLNPFTDGAGYNVAVALNFTQTKMEMPKTKQSSISNFFTCQRRVLKKICTSGRPNASAQEEFSSVRATATGDSDDFNNEPLWSGDLKQEGNTQQTEPHAALWWENEDEECNLASLPNIHRYYKKESSTDMSQLMNKSNITSYTCNMEQENSQDPLYSNHFLSSLPTQNSFNTFGGLFNAQVRTSTQKTFKRPSLQNDKENSIPKYPRMPMHDSHVQIMSKQTKLERLQNDISLETCTQDQDEGCNSPIKWTKPKNSLKKKLKCQFRDSDDENMSMLFTQDSQGFRVIAHRGLQTRNALKDQSNVTAMKRPEEDEGDEDEEMLFTQDSQGNMVIKH